jgi:hypothetical protein
MDYIQGIFSLSPAGLQVLILADITTPTWKLGKLSHKRAKDLPKDTQLTKSGAKTQTQDWHKFRAQECELDH